MTTTLIIIWFACGLVSALYITVKDTDVFMVKDLFFFLFTVCMGFFSLLCMILIIGTVPVLKLLVKISELMNKKLF